MSSQIHSYIDSLNCMIDLHLHLDGAISLSSARQLAAISDVSIPASDDDLLKLLRVSPNCRDLNEFLEKFAFPCSLLQTKESIKQAVVNLLSELNEQSVIYAEIRFAPQKSTDKGLSMEDAVLAAISGTENSPVKCNLILCCMRDSDNLDENLETVRLTHKYLGKGVCAADLAGAEALFPTSDFEEVFALARELNVPFTIHAGEADGPQSIKCAIDMGASRIGHGLRAADDDSLIELLASKHIPLEMCPTSNLNTCACDSYENYPLPAFLRAGIPVTINTDDPSIEGTTIKKEFRALSEALGLNPDDILNLLFCAAKSSFASDDVKKELIQIISNYRTV